MSKPPGWYGQLKWSSPVSLAVLNTDRSCIPNFPGCYAFTIGRGALLLRKVLYIGDAESLRQRLAVYLVDWRAPKGHEGHKGKGFVLEARKKHTDQGIYVRWVEYGGDHNLLEASLIHYLEPQCNDRDESARVGLLADGERLDRRLLR